MHFGAVVRDVLTASYGSDLRHAKAHTVLPEVESPQTLRLLATNLELAFGVAVPEADLEHLTTVRDVLQCVRLRRWARRVEAAQPALPAAVATAEAATAAEAPTPTTIAAQAIDPRQERFRFTRRSSAPSDAPPVDRPPATPGPKHR